MTLAPHTIHAVSGSRKRSRRVGRGHGSGRGTSAGRGTKGQRARTGGRSRTALRPLKRELQKVPKLRGFKSRHEEPQVVALGAIERQCSGGDVVTPLWLKEKGLIHSIETDVKVLSGGTLTKQITLQDCLASKTAVAIIEKVGGKVVF